MSDDVEVALDFKEAQGDLLPKEAPLVLVLHGLGGHSMTNSCYSMTEVLARQNWRVVVYNRRGHGGTSLMPPHAASTAQDGIKAYDVKLTVGGTKAFPQHVDLDDMRCVAAYVAARYPDAPKALLGLSAGGNLCVYYQGECANESPFKAAVSVSNGHELTQLTSTLLDKEHMADWLLVTFLKEILYERWHEVVALTERAGLAVDWARLLRCRHTRHFEEQLTAQLYGYRTVDEYYYRNSSCHHFDKVKAPMLSLANKDDPIIDEDLIRHAQEGARSNPHIISVSTTRGGHLGWLHGRRAECWMHNIICEYFTAVFPAPAIAQQAAYPTKPVA